MKIAVLADIHGNLRALHAVCYHIDRWAPDKVLVAGDIVNRGPRSPACYDVIEERCARDGWLVVRGNHEEYVIERATAEAPMLPQDNDVFGAVDWTRRSLGTRVAKLPHLPTELRLVTSAGEIFLTHGSLLGSRDGIYPHSTDEELRKKVKLESLVFAVGHTHRPFNRRFNGCMVVNAGSVGMPFDGDPRPAYARIEIVKDQVYAKIVRISYDQAAAEKDFALSGFMDGSGPIGRIVLDEFRVSLPRLAAWTRKYHEAVLTGKLTVSQSVDSFLSELAT